MKITYLSQYATASRLGMIVQIRDLKERETGITTETLMPRRYKLSWGRFYYKMHGDGWRATYSIQDVMNTKDRMTAYVEIISEH